MQTVLMHDLSVPAGTIADVRDGDDVLVRFTRCQQCGNVGVVRVKVVERRVVGGVVKRFRRLFPCGDTQTDVGETETRRGGMTRRTALVAAAVVLAGLLAAGCGDKTLVRVRVVSSKSTFGGGLFEPFPYTVVERIDTGERVKLRGAEYGGVGDEFAIQDKNLRW